MNNLSTSGIVIHTRSDDLNAVKFNHPDGRCIETTWAKVFTVEEMYKVLEKMLASPNNECVRTEANNALVKARGERVRRPRPWLFHRRAESPP